MQNIDEVSNESASKNSPSKLENMNYLEVKMPDIPNLNLSSISGRQMNSSMGYSTFGRLTEEEKSVILQRWQNKKYVTMSKPFNYSE